jgi:hypothetical protein
MFTGTDAVAALPEVDAGPAGEVLIVILYEPHYPAGSIAPRAGE